MVRAALPLLAVVVAAAACDGPSTPPPNEPASKAEASPKDAAPSPGTPKDTEPPASPEDDAKAPAPPPAETYTLGRHALRLETRDDGCTVHATTDGADPTSLSLGIEPPCYWLRWPYPLPSKPAESGGQPRGTESEPMAWAYADAEDTTAVIVIGGPLTETNPETLSKLQDLHCGEKTQAVLLSADGVRISRRIAEGSVSCEGSGTDEREFWIFAHEG